MKGLSLMNSTSNSNCERVTTMTTTANHFAPNLLIERLREMILEDEEFQAASIEYADECLKPMRKHNLPQEVMDELTCQYQVQFIAHVLGRIAVLS